LRIDVIELENDGVRLPAIDTRMSTAVLDDKRAVPLAIALSCLAAPNVVLLRIAHIVLPAI
jgi:hypothetical protein